MYKVTVPTIVTNGHFNKEKTLAELKRCKADRVALAIDREIEYAFSSEEHLSLLRELIAYYRENGLETLVWLGETLGHPTGFAMDPQEDVPYRRMRAVSGETLNSFCPLDESFQRDFCKWVADVAACGVSMIMLDDDFRMGVRFVGDGTGCCCDLHMKRIRETLGEEIALDKLRDKVFAEGPNPYRDVWQKVQKESLEELAHALRVAIDRVAPETRLGFCSCFDWDVSCDVFRLTKIMAGSTRPFLRLTGAPYWTCMGLKVGQSVEVERMLAEWCRKENFEIFSEGDTYPRPRTAVPAAYLECFDMILRADGGTDGILKYMLDYCSDADYETGYVDAAVRNQPLYTEIARMFNGKKCVGVRPYHHRERFGMAEPKEDSVRNVGEYQYNIRRSTAAFAVMNSLPTTYGDGDFVNILFGDDGRYVTEAELKNGSVIDFAAAKFLMGRGIDVGIQSCETPKRYSAVGFTDTPCEYFPEEDCYVRLDPGVEVQELIHKPGVHILSEFCYGRTRRKGVFEYRNAQGMYFLVFPFAASEVLLDGKTNARHGWLDSYARRRQFLQAASRIGCPPAVYCRGNHPYLYVLTKQGEASLAVGLWNLYPDAVYHGRIQVNFDFDQVDYVNCSGHREGNCIVLDTILYPYEFAGMELKN